MLLRTENRGKEQKKIKMLEMQVLKVDDDDDDD